MGSKQSPLSGQARTIRAGTSMLTHVVVIPLVLQFVGLVRHGTPAVPPQSILAALKDAVGILHGKCKGKVAAPLRQGRVESPGKQRVALNLARRGVQC